MVIALLLPFSSTLAFFGLSGYYNWHDIIAQYIQPEVLPYPSQKTDIMYTWSFFFLFGLNFLVVFFYTNIKQKDHHVSN